MYSVDSTENKEIAAAVARRLLGLPKPLEEGATYDDVLDMLYFSPRQDQGRQPFFKTNSQTLWPHTMRNGEGTYIIQATSAREYTLLGYNLVFDDSIPVGRLELCFVE